jgi:hypothetical protein
MNERLAHTARRSDFVRPRFGGPLTVAHPDSSAYQMKHQEFRKMRKQIIAAATAIALGMATTAIGTTAFARGGGGHGGGGHGGGHSGGFGGGGHGFGHAMGHGGFGGHTVAINRGSIGHGRLDGRRFGRGFYAYGGNYCDPYYYPYGCYGY